MASSGPTAASLGTAAATGVSSCTQPANVNNSLNRQDHEPDEDGPTVVWVTVENTNGQFKLNHSNKNPNLKPQDQADCCSDSVSTDETVDSVVGTNSVEGTNGTTETEKGSTVDDHDDIELYVIDNSDRVEIKQEPLDEMQVQERRETAKTAQAFVPPSIAYSQSNESAVKTENVETGESTVYIQQHSSPFVIQTSTGSYEPAPAETQVYAVQTAENTMQTVVMEGARVQQNQEEVVHEQQMLMQGESSLQPVHMIINNSALPGMPCNEMAVVVIDNTGDHENVEAQGILQQENNSSRWRTPTFRTVASAGKDSFSFLNVQTDPSENLGMQTIIVEPVFTQPTWQNTRSSYGKTNTKSKYMPVGLIPHIKCAQPKSIPKRHPRTKRPRRIVTFINNQKIITADAMKNQVRDTSDIVARMNVAPPTKKIMKLQQTTVKSLLNSPGRPIGSRELDVYYRDHLITKPVPLEEVFEPSDDMILEAPGLEEEHNYNITETRSLSILHYK